MTHSISLWIFNIQCIIILTAFVYSIRLLKKCEPNIMRFFVLYTFIAVSVMIPMFLHANKIMVIKFADQLNNISIVFNYNFLFFFIFFTLPDRKGYKLIFLIYFLFLLLMLLTLFSKNIYSPIQRAFAINYFGLAVFSIIYLYKLFQNVPNKVITNIPTFWVVMGILISASFGFPLIFIIDYIRKIGIDFSNNLILVNLPNIGYALFYLFLIKSFKCSVIN